MAYREASRIPAVTLEELVGSNPTIEMVIREPIGDLAVGTLWDLFALVAIARTIKAQRIFEFGTGYGDLTP